MFSVLCTVSPSLLAKAWSKGDFPLAIKAQKSVFRMNRCKNEYFSIRLANVNVPCLSLAFTSAPISSRVSKQGSLSDSSLARSKGLLSWICQVDCLNKMLRKQRRYYEIKTGHKHKYKGASPCLSFQCLLRARPAASPCPACSSKLLYVEGCSKTLGLQSRKKDSH